MNGRLHWIPCCLVALAVATVGCDRASDHAASPEAEEKTETVSPAPKAVVNRPVISPADGTGSAPSRYSSLRGCELTRSEQEGVSYSVRRCTGLGSYALEVVDADGREDLAVLRGTDRRQLGLPGLIDAGFGTLGTRAEWRLPANRTEPLALIVRYAVADLPAEPDQTTSFLVVVGLERRCVVGKVEPGADQNAEARRMADRPGECLRRES